MLKYLKSNPAIFICLLAVFLMFLFTPGVILVIIVVSLVLIGHTYEHLVIKKKQHLDVTQTPKSGRYISFEAKQEYLQSTKWEILRQLTLLRDNYTCQTCGAKHNLQIHHITYENLGNENPENLVTLCAQCHSALHEELGYSRHIDYPIK